MGVPSLADKQVHIGIHSIAFRNRSTGELYSYGELLVTGDVSINPNVEQSDLIGGSRLTKWGSARTGMAPELTLSVMEFQDAMYQVAFGATVNRVAASATGTVGTLTNKTGTSLQSATTGIASVGAKSGGSASMKTGFYVVKAASATTVHVYYFATLDLSRGTNLSIADLETNQITATALTITASAAVEIPGTGLELTGGSGVIAMTTADTAIFYVYKPHGGAVEISVGASDAQVPEVEILVAGKDDNGRQCLLQVFRAKDKGGVPMNFARGEYSSAEMTFDLFLDETEDLIYKLTFIKPE